MAPALQICSSANMFMYDLMQFLAFFFPPRALFFPDRRVVVSRIDPVVSGSQASVPGKSEPP